MFKKKIIKSYNQEIDLPIEIIKIFNELGYKKSLDSSTPVDKDGSPLPWFTYPAIQYLQQLDVSSAEVFEWGGGNSTVFFSQKAKSVYTVERNFEWFTYINRKNLHNVTIFHKQSKDDYINCIKETNKTFDIILIDADFRLDCAKIAIDFLKEGGFIIVDNADNSKEACKVLRNRSLIQADYSGFGPICKYLWTTSFFYTRQFNFQTIDDIQPKDPICNLQRNLDNWDSTVNE